MLVFNLNRVCLVVFVPNLLVLSGGKLWSKVFQREPSTYGKDSEARSGTFSEHAPQPTRGKLGGGSKGFICSSRRLFCATGYLFQRLP
jgi:hypothetical protein